MRHRVSLTAALILQIAQPASAQDAGAIRTILWPGDAIAPGCAAAVFDKDRTSIFASGYADIERKRLLDGDTQFYVASISKQFTALAATQLILAGKLKAGDDVRKFIPELPRYETTITVDMLMHHSAGVRDPIALVRLSGYPVYGQFTRAEVLAMVLRQQGTNFTPGTRYEYSNGGFLLLSEIVARVSGRSFADYVDANILAPLGMQRSFMLAGAKPSGSNVARGYIPKDTGFELRDTYPLYGGAGGLITTLNDLGHYHRDIIKDHKVWTPAVAALMERPGRLTDGSSVRMSEVEALYAAGLMINGDWIEHGGDADGFRSNYARRRDGSRGMAVFCNRGDAAPTDKTDAILKFVAPELPPVRIPPTAPEANGRFVSDELHVEYRVVTTGGRMTIARVPAGMAEAPAPPLILKQIIDGSFVSDDGRTRIALDPSGEGFVLDNWRAARIRFRRVG